jgi:hypothetical protein
MPSAVGAGRHSLRRVLLPASIIACLLVLAVAVAGAAGGLDELPPPALPEVAEDEVHEGQPWNVRVEGAALATQLEPARLVAGGYWLAVIADIEVVADTSRGDVTDVLYQTGMDGLARESAESAQYPGAIFADDVRLVRDGNRADQLHPGMIERLAFLWELTSDTAPPADVTVVIVNKTYRQDSFSGQMAWLDGEASARVTVPVNDWREEDT